MKWADIMLPLKQDDKGNVTLSAILVGLIVLVVGLALIPTVQTSVNTSITAVGSTSAAGSIISLMPLFFVLVILGGILVLIVFND